jgi:WhiB family redox-sensing transcriptional regulator
MAQAERTQDSAGLAAQASARYGSRGVPGDWYVDPADPAAAERYLEDAESSLEDQATAFLAAHDTLTVERSAGSPALEEPETASPLRGSGVEHVEQAVWIGLPGIGGADHRDESGLGWQTDALCAQTDPEAFFPEKGGSTRDAKKVCGTCTVRADCLEYALANDERFGIWGGLSERERRRLRKRAI